eukprot:1264376-Rhodomonas_salina.3
MQPRPDWYHHTARSVLGTADNARRTIAEFVPDMSEDPWLYPGSTIHDVSTRHPVPATCRQYQTSRTSLGQLTWT